MTDLETLRAALRQCLSVMELRESAPPGVTIGMHFAIERSKIALGLGPDKPIMQRIQPGDDPALDMACDALRAAMMAPDAPETCAERTKHWMQAHGRPDPLAASPAGQTIPGGVVDAIRRVAVTDPDLADRVKKLIEGRNNPPQYSLGDGPGLGIGHPPTDFGSQVTEALAHGRGIDPGGQGMRVPTPAEKEAERARQAEYFRRNGVL